MILDAGCLIAVDRGEDDAVALVMSTRTRGVDLVTSAGVVAQVWRGGARQARLSTLLSAVHVVDLDAAEARFVGRLLAAVGGSDVVDGHIAVIALRAGLAVATADRDDMERLGVPPGGIIDM